MTSKKPDHLSDCLDHLWEQVDKARKGSKRVTVDKMMLADVLVDHRRMADDETSPDSRSARWVKGVAGAIMLVVLATAPDVKAADVDTVGALIAHPDDAHAQLYMSGVMNTVAMYEAGKVCLPEGALFEPRLGFDVLAKAIDSNEGDLPLYFAPALVRFGLLKLHSCK